MSGCADTALTGSPVLFQTALADTLELDFAHAGERPSCLRAYARLLTALRALDLDVEQAFLITAATYPSQFPQAEKRSGCLLATLSRSVAHEVALERLPHGRRAPDCRPVALPAPLRRPRRIVERHSLRQRNKLFDRTAPGSISTTQMSGSKRVSFSSRQIGRAESSPVSSAGNRVRPAWRCHSWSAVRGRRALRRPACRAR